MRRLLLPALAGAALFGFGLPTLTASASPVAPSAIDAPTGGIEEAQMTRRQMVRRRMMMRDRRMMRNRMMMRRDMRRRMMMRRRMR